MKRSLFKATVAATASVAMLAGLAGCGRTDDTADSGDDVSTIGTGKATGDLTIWAMGNEGDVLSDFVKDFESENPDVNVKVTAIPWSSAHDKLQTAIATGEVPDVAQMGNTWMADFSNAFSEVPSDLDLSGFFEGPAENYKVGGMAVLILAWISATFRADSSPIMPIGIIFTSPCSSLFSIFANST